MADETLAEAMIDQPGVADGTGKAMPACPAQRQRRVAAAIEEQQRLLAPRNRDLNLLCEPWRDEAAAAGGFATQIDRLDLRHVLAAEPRQQHHARVPAVA